MLEARSQRAYDKFVAKLSQYDISKLNDEFARFYLKAQCKSSEVVRKHRKPPIHGSAALSYDIYSNRSEEPSGEKGLVQLMESLISFKDARLTVECHLSTGDDYCGEFEVTVRCGKSRLALIIVRDTTEQSARLISVWKCVEEFFPSLNYLIIADHISTSRALPSADSIPQGPVKSTTIVVNDEISAVTYMQDETKKMSELNRLPANDCLGFFSDPNLLQWWKAATTAAGIVGSSLVFGSTYELRDTSGNYGGLPELNKIFKLKICLPGDLPLMDIVWKPKKRKAKDELFIKPQDQKDDIWDILTDGLHEKERVKDLAGLVFLHIYWPKMFELLTEEATRIKLEDMSAIQLQKTLEFDSSRYLMRSGINEYFQPSDRSISRDVKQMDFKVIQNKLQLIPAAPPMDFSRKELDRRPSEEGRKRSDIKREVLQPTPEDLIHQSYIQMAQYLFSNFRQSVLKLESYVLIRLIGEPVHDFRPKLPILSFFDEEFVSKVSFELKELSMELCCKYIQESDEHKIILKTPSREIKCRVKYKCDQSYLSKLPIYLAIENMVPLLASKIVTDSLIDQRSSSKSIPKKLTIEKSTVTDDISKGRDIDKSRSREKSGARSNREVQSVIFSAEQNKKAEGYHSRSMQQGEDMQEGKGNPSNSLNIFFEEQDNSRVSGNNTYSIFDMLVNKDALSEKKVCANLCGLPWLESHKYFSTGFLSYNDPSVTILRKKFSTPKAKEKIGKLQLKYSPTSEFQSLVMYVAAEVGNMKIKHVVRDHCLYCYVDSTKQCIWKLEVTLKDNDPWLPYSLTALITSRLLLKDYYKIWMQSFMPRLKSWSPPLNLNKPSSSMFDF